jgi:type II secretory pathway component PulJ
MNQTNIIMPNLMQRMEQLERTVQDLQRDLRREQSLREEQRETLRTLQTSLDEYEEREARITDRMLDAMHTFLKKNPSPEQCEAFEFVDVELLNRMSSEKRVEFIKPYLAQVLEQGYTPHYQHAVHSNQESILRALFHFHVWPKTKAEVEQLEQHVQASDESDECGAMRVRHIFGWNTFILEEWWTLLENDAFVTHTMKLLTKAVEDEECTLFIFTNQKMMIKHIVRLMKECADKFPTTWMHAAYDWDPATLNTTIKRLSVTLLLFFCFMLSASIDDHALQEVFIKQWYASIAPLLPPRVQLACSKYFRGCIVPGTAASQSMRETMDHLMLMHACTSKPVVTRTKFLPIIPSRHHSIKDDMLDVGMYDLISEGLFVEALTREAELFSSDVTIGSTVPYITPFLTSTWHLNAKHSVWHDARVQAFLMWVCESHDHETLYHLTEWFKQCGITMKQALTHWLKGMWWKSRQLVDFSTCLLETNLIRGFCDWLTRTFDVDWTSEECARDVVAAFAAQTPQSFSYSGARGEGTDATIISRMHALHWDWMVREMVMNRGLKCCIVEPASGHTLMSLALSSVHYVSIAERMLSEAYHTQRSCGRVMPLGLDALDHSRVIYKDSEHCTTVEDWMDAFKSCWGKMHVLWTNDKELITHTLKKWDGDIVYMESTQPKGGWRNILFTPEWELVPESGTEPVQRVVDDVE